MATANTRPFSDWGVGACRADNRPCGNPPARSSSTRVKGQQHRVLKVVRSRLECKATAFLRWVRWARWVVEPTASSPFSSTSLSPLLSGAVQCSLLYQQFYQPPARLSLSRLARHFFRSHQEFRGQKLVARHFYQQERKNSVSWSITASAPALQPRVEWAPIARLLLLLPAASAAVPAPAARRRRGSHEGRRRCVPRRWRQAVRPLTPPPLTLPHLHISLYSFLFCPVSFLLSCSVVSSDKNPDLVRIWICPAHSVAVFICAPFPLFRCSLSLRNQ